MSKATKNHLEGEKSRYLRQHADNPVDWYPWSQEPFEKAEEKDRPLFISIGYSSCHWCHVMAHESFEDEAVAELMNETFVCVKVDKEERPDVNNFFMNVARAMSNTGGWPLNVITTPEKEPIYAATYIPKESRPGMVGLKELAEKVDELWKNDRERLIETGSLVLERLESDDLKQEGSLDISNLDSCFSHLKRDYSAKDGGFGTAPKFPSPHKMIFLLRYWDRKGNEKALEMAENTLLKMRRGGIYDHLGYGFHRYSTDREWRLPHFEKMLYDQGMMIWAYLEAFQATGDERFAKTVKEVIEYLVRDMGSKLGTFYSSEDADVGEEEGAYYTWTLDELIDVVHELDIGDKKETEKLLKTLFDVDEKGNYEEEATGKKTGKNVLYRRNSLEEMADESEKGLDELRPIYNEIREALLERREKRERPGKDKKILTDWNGLVLFALSRASRVLGKDLYLKRAKRCADFLLDEMVHGESRIYHSYIERGEKTPGNLDDHAYLVLGLIELYQASSEVRYLKKGIELTESMMEHHWDEERYGFYFAPDDVEELPFRNKEVYDGAYPTGNSIAFLSLSRLYGITGRDLFQKRADEMSRAFPDKISSLEGQYGMFMSALDLHYGPTSEIVVVGDEEVDPIRINKRLETVYSPKKTVVFKTRDMDDYPEGMSYLKGMKPIDGVTYYLCRDFTCQNPTTDLSKLLNDLTAG